MPKIDYLNEDQPISGQKYALISIIGPHMPQKSDVWAIKIKGTSHSEEAADKLGQRLQQLDPDIDIHRVPVGIFFPLAIDPSSADNIVYQNEQLNEIVKKNKENRMDARDHFEERKRSMMEDAIKEGREQGNTQEHPIAVLNDIHKSEKRIQELQTELKNAKSELNIAKLKFDTFSIEEKTNSANEYNKINEIAQETKQEITYQSTGHQLPSSINTPTSSLTSLSNNSLLTSATTEPRTTLSTLKEENNSLFNVKEIELINEKIKKGKLSESELSILLQRRELLKEKLNDKDSINNLVNDNFQNNNYGIF